MVRFLFLSFVLYHGDYSRWTVDGDVGGNDCDYGYDYEYHIRLQFEISFVDTSFFVSCAKLSPVSAEQWPRLVTDPSIQESIQC